MHTLERQLSLFQDQQGPDDIPIPVVLLNNPDGSPRWLCHAGAGYPHFLHFYLVNNWRSWLFSSLIRLVFLFRMQRLFFTSRTLYLRAWEDHQGWLLDFTTQHWAIFMGTPGPNNKIQVYDKRAEGAYFYKIPNPSATGSLLRNEHKTIKHLKQLGISAFTYPAAKLLPGAVLCLSDVSQNGRRVSDWSTAHTAALRDLYTRTGDWQERSVNSSINSALDRLRWLQRNIDSRIPQGMVDKLLSLAETLPYRLRIALAHGDFTPWNMYACEGRLALYDWELSNTCVPVGFDAFHYLINKGILQQRQSWSQIRTAIQPLLQPEFFSSLTGTEGLHPRDYLHAYLLINCSYYLLIYSRQEEWHEQVYWLLDTWSAALSDCLQEQQLRPQLIRDVFDKMQQFPYSALKFPDCPPEQLSPYSDIDLFLKKADARRIHSFLREHPYIACVQTEPRSHMQSVQAYTHSGEILSLDLIWDLKWKHLQMLAPEQLLSGSTLNAHGVYQLKSPLQATYLGLFYQLNGADVPDKYSDAIHDLNTSTLLQQLLQQDLPAERKRGALIRLLRQHSANRGLAGINRRLHYAIDCLRMLVGRRGLIITFSGVDGAGKSTIIEHTQREIEKKLRRPVVVLRHRPSVLPILSAWTKGKAAAEQDSAQRLPRQGKNHSFLGSLLRFTYYYCDYLLGQIYVHLRYSLLGYVVLYDRYYFDFINDPRRSNIQLPKRLLRTGYWLIRKPDLNFFLYAPAQVILQRKQELDEASITALTSDYLQLFRELDPQHQRYVPIENVDLEQTLQHIFSKTLQISMG